MDFVTTKSADGKVLVIDLPRRLTSDTADGLKKLLKEYVNSGNYKFVMNLALTEYLDSSGLGAIVSKIAQTRSNSGDIRIAAPKEYVINLLELTHVMQIIKIYDTPEQAVASYGE